jgi:hypothetical protein
MKASLRFLLFFLLPALSSFADNSWPGIPFSEVRAYAWLGDTKKEQAEAVILPGMVLGPGVINKDGLLLTPRQVKRLLAAVNGKHPRVPIAACYAPHNAFVFYNADRKPVAFVEVCFDCLNYRIEPRGASDYADLVSLASLFDAQKLPLGAYSSLGEFRKHLKRVNQIAK